MSEKSSAFEKIHVDEREKNDWGGVLEQLNLPPAFITFVRENKRLVQIVIAAIVLVVVAWALYDSYQEKRIEEAASALSLAVDIEDAEAKINQLTAVTNTYSGTTAALWAQVHTAHEMMKSEQKDTALQMYRDVLQNIKESSPLYPLVSVAVAQTEAMLGNYSEAAREYERIKAIEGYQDIGFLGLARINEEQGDLQRALQIYEEYLATLMNVTQINQKALVEEKIARLRALL